MDRAIDKYPTVAFGIAHEEAGLVEEVAGVAADDEGLADGAGFDLGGGVAVAGVEAAGEAGHDFEVRAEFGGVDDALCLELYGKYTGVGGDEWL